MSKHHETDYFEKGKPVHRTSYCAFLDILGFSDRIKESFELDQADQLLQEFHEIFSKQLKRMEDECNDSLLYFKSFTDNIVLAHPRFSDDMESEFAFTLWALSEYQYSMAIKGFFIRGGLAVGDLFISESNVYGPALLEAYKLESSTAVNPCVILSNDAMGLVAHHCKFYVGEIAPQHREIYVNSEGGFFINYLSECIYDTGTSEEVDWDGLALHKEQIENALKKYSNVSRVFNKFVWLANYHNYFCNTVREYTGYNKRFRVSSKLASSKIYKLSDVLPK